MSRASGPEKLHERGERGTVRWPGVPDDVVPEFSYAEPSTMSGREDWLTIHGVCVEHEGPQHHGGRSFFVRRVAGEERTYALLPEKG